MPEVTIKTGFIGPDGREEELTAYLCDFADCPQAAVEVIGVVKELGASFAVCEAHAAVLKKKRKSST